VELRDKGIRVNSVNPGPILTDMFKSNTQELQDFMRATYPVGEPEDVADVVTFLAGPNSRWITGSTVATNNGALMH